ncbi:pyrroloquinoline quinone biosynthesis protein PqqB [Streptosporangium sp. NPDC003464]
MRVQVLGSVAGGGLPQWNCGCPGCSGARANASRRRLQASLALEVEPGRVYVVNATPDIGRQIEACPWLRPRGRSSPLAGVILTDAELDHTLGLAQLREAEELDVIATERVRQAVGSALTMLHPYLRLRWRDFGEVVAGIEVRAVPISGKRPRYAGGSPDGTWVIGLRVGGLVYAPAMSAWPAEFGAGAEVVFADGTFYDDDEPRRSGISARSATQMGHLPIEATRARLAALDARCFYTHLNNTNPLLDPDSPLHASLGVEVAAEGMVIEL